MVSFVRENTFQFALLLGAALPILTAVVQQPRWNKRVRTVVAVAVSLLAGVITVSVDGGFAQGAAEPLAVLAAVVAAAEAAYEKVWQPTGAAQVIERVTSPVRGETVDWV